MPFFWAIGYLLAYAAIAFFYIRRSRHRGVGTPVRPYILARIGIAVLFAATEFWGTAHVTTPAATIDFWGLRLDPNAGPTVLLERFTGPAAFVGVPLLVLSWVERSRALLLFSLAYLALELALPATGWAGIPATSPWSSLPRLAVPATFLLLGALGFALTQLPRQRATSGRTRRGRKPSGARSGPRWTTGCSTSSTTYVRASPPHPTPNAPPATSPVAPVAVSPSADAISTRVRESLACRLHDQC